MSLLSKSLEPSSFSVVTAAKLIPRQQKLPNFPKLFLFKMLRAVSVRKVALIILPPEGSDDRSDRADGAQKYSNANKKCSRYGITKDDAIWIDAKQ